MICFIFTIFFLAMILIIISFTFTFCPLLQLLQCFKSFGQTGFAFGIIRIVLKSSRKLAMIRKNPDSFETVRKIGNHLENSRSF